MRMFSWELRGRNMSERRNISTPVTIRHTPLPEGDFQKTLALSLASHNNRRKNMKLQLTRCSDDQGGKNWALFPHTVAGSKAMTHCFTARLRLGCRSVDSNLWQASRSNCSCPPPKEGASPHLLLRRPALRLWPHSGPFLAPKYENRTRNYSKLRCLAQQFQLSCQPGRRCSVRHDHQSNPIHALHCKKARDELKNKIFLCCAQDARCRKVEVEDVALFGGRTVESNSIHSRIQEGQQLGKHSLVAKLISFDIP